MRIPILSILVFIIFLTACANEESEDLSYSWYDVHGAGSQRSDPKSGSLSDYGSEGVGYYNELAPQGDAVRIYNYVRLVRDSGGVANDFPIVDTNQSKSFDDTESITAPSNGDDYYGQDSQNDGNQPDYTISDDGYTVYDDVTALTWMKGPNRDLSTPTASDKLSYSEALTYVDELNASSYGGYSDWRLPSAKELYSLIEFSGEDISGYEDDDTSSLIPFIDNSYFNFAYGETDAGERLIDSQYLTDNTYVSTENGTLYFGVNFADGRIKGYSSVMMDSDKTFFVQLVRGNTSYGVNYFTNNGDETITDAATGLMWMKNDSGEGMNWQEALAWAQTKNDENYLGHSDWRLPNAKEMQSIVDYSHAPDYDGLASIDSSYFSCTEITNESGESDFPWYWTSTTHETMSDTTSGSAGVYIPFGRAMGYSN